MNQQVEQLLTAGESRNVEFKASRQLLSDNLFETVCAFLNRDGGEIFLGMTDAGIAKGIDLNRLPQMKRDFANAINNPQKLTPPCHFSIEEAEHDGVMLLHIVVPPSSQVHRCNGRIYDRNEDGYYDITGNQDLVAQRYISKQNYYSENTIYPYAALADLDSEVIEKVRKLAGIRQPEHPWLSMNDEELIDSAQLRQRDYQRDIKGLTLASILLFGKDSTILSVLSVLSVLPHHRTDAILRRINVDRYDDRDDIRTNLIDSRSRLLAFGDKHLNDPFYLEENQQVSLRARIMREIIGNLLIHREYSHAFPAKLVIESKRLFTENSNKPNASGRIDPKLFSPFPKNPAIARVFREVGWADELGSGVRNLYQYCKDFCGHDPEFIEDDIFRFSLSFVGSEHETPGKISEETSKALYDKQLRQVEGSEKTSQRGSEKTLERGSEKTLERGSEKTPERGSEEIPQRRSEEIVEETSKTLRDKHLRQEVGSEEIPERGSEETTENILGMMRGNASVSAAEIAQALGMSARVVERHIARLKATGRIGLHWSRQRRYLACATMSGARHMPGMSRFGLGFS